MFVSAQFIKLTVQLLVVELASKEEYFGYEKRPSGVVFIFKKGHLFNDNNNKGLF